MSFCCPLCCSTNFILRMMLKQYILIKIFNAPINTYYMAKLYWSKSAKKLIITNHLYIAAVYISSGRLPILWYLRLIPIYDAQRQHHKLFWTWKHLHHRRLRRKKIFLRNDNNIPEVMSYLPDTDPGSRLTIDRKIILFGKKLINICKLSHLRIVNGRHKTTPI